MSRLRLIGRPIKHAAFTLIEMVISMAILILTSQLLVATVGVLQKAIKVTQQQQNTIDWHISTIQLDEFLADAYFTNYQSQDAPKIIFRKPDTNQSGEAAETVYYLKRMKNEMIVVSQLDGYMPLLGNLKQLQLDYQRPFVQIDATFTDQRRYQHDVFLEEQDEQAKKKKVDTN